MLLSFKGQVLGQDISKAVLHVTSVRKQEAKDYCQDGSCTATRITVEGHTVAKIASDSITYVLECVETTFSSPPSTGAEWVCPRPQAHGDYDVTFPSADYLRFEHQPQLSGKKVYNGYKIVLEREKEPDHRLPCEKYPTSAK